MKLKKAIKLAKDQGFNYVAVDADLSIVAFHDYPRCAVVCEEWLYGGSFGHVLGSYSGSKTWTKTLREVK